MEIADIKSLLHTLEELQKVCVNPIIGSLAQRAITMQMSTCLSEIIERCAEMQTGLIDALDAKSIILRSNDAEAVSLQQYSTAPPNNGEVLRAVPVRHHVNRGHLQL